MKKNATQLTLTRQEESTEIGVIRYAVHSTNELLRQIDVTMANGKKINYWPFSPESSNDSDAIEALAAKVLKTSKKGAKYSIIKGRYVFNDGKPCFTVDEVNPTHVMFITDRGLRAYGGVNGYDVMNISKDVHVVAIPINKARFEVENRRFL